jgi:5-methylcytosine-specific restriction endonuclease McrA
VKQLIIYLCLIALFVSLLVICGEKPYIDHHPDDPTIVSGEPRSSQWSTVRKNFLRYNPRCVACGTDQDLNVHHIVPYHVDRSKELDPTNLVTLCREHHLKYGHRCYPNYNVNWKCENPNVIKDAKNRR